MPRPKKKKAEPVFAVHGRELSEDTKRELVHLLGCQPDFVFLDIASALGLYVDGQHHLDRPPRSADYVREFAPLARDIKKLLERLKGLSGYYRDQFSQHGVDIESVEHALAEAARTSDSVVASFERRSSKGAPRNAALIATIQTLRTIFERHYKGDDSERQKVGAFEYRSDKERRELDFVRVALVGARIIKHADSRLERLFRDPNSQPVSDQ